MNVDVGNSIFRNAIVGIAAVLLAGFALASPPERNKWQKEAYERGCEKDQLSMNLCSEYDYEVLDSELNDLFQQQLSRLSHPSRARLVNAERAWLKYRDADCLYQNGPREESGSIWPLEQNICLSTRTKQRIELIKSFIACTDNGCPE